MTRTQVTEAKLVEAAKASCRAQGCDCDVTVKIQLIDGNYHAKVEHDDECFFISGGDRTQAVLIPPGPPYDPYPWETKR